MSIIHAQCKLRPPYSIFTLHLIDVFLMYFVFTYSLNKLEF